MSAERQAVRAKVERFRRESARMHAEVVEAFDRATEPLEKVDRISEPANPLALPAWDDPDRPVSRH